MLHKCQVIRQDNAIIKAIGKATQRKCLVIRQGNAISKTRCKATQCNIQGIEQDKAKIQNNGLGRTT